MADISWEEYGNAIGSTTGDVLSGVADAAGAFICDIWQNNPLQLTGTPLGDAASAYTSALADRLCKPRGIEPPADSSIPLSGGQCKCRQYHVTWRLTVNGETYSTGSDMHPGPVGSPYKVKETGGGASWRYDYGHPDCDGRQSQGILSSSDPASLDNFKVEDFEATPVDGLPDDCGDFYPPIRQGNIVPYSPAPIVSIPGPGGLGPINVAPVIIPVTLAPTINFKPEFNVSLGPFNVNINPGGFDINLNPEFNFPITPGADNPSYPTAPPGTPTKPPNNGKGEENCCDVIDEINDKVDELLDCERCAKEYQVIPNGASSGNANIVTGLMDEVVYAEVNVTTVPVNRKTQWGGGAIDVEWLGWFWFLRDGKPDERLPIDADSKTFTAPAGVNGYAYTLYVGCNGNATAYSRREVTES